jgi:hypothetical protein
MVMREQREQMPPSPHKRTAAREGKLGRTMNKRRRQSSMDDRVSARLPEIQETGKSRSITHKKKHSKRTKARDGTKTESTKRIPEDPYEHH